VNACAVCDYDITTGEPKGYDQDNEPVHLACARQAKVPCPECHLIHAGGCW